MRLFRFVDPREDRWADATRVGTWEGPEELCPTCGRSFQERVDPLVIEWEPGSEAIADFTWPGFDDEVVVKESVGESLLSEFLGFGCQPIKMRDRKEGTSDPIVKLPYDGPALREIKPIVWVAIDLERSTLEIDVHCDVCDAKSFNVQGVEHKSFSWDEDLGELRHVRVPRVRGKGILSRADSIGDASVFKVQEVPGWVLCTEEVRTFVVDKNWSNVDFLEVGEVV